MIEINNVPHTMKLTVEENDIDLFGHMNYLRYIEYLEAARSDWFEAAGISFARMAEMNIGVVLLKFEMHYIGEAVLKDELTIHTIPLTLGTKSFVLKQMIYKKDGTQLTEASFTNVMFDTEARKSIPVAEELVRQFTTSSSSV